MEVYTNNNYNCIIKIYASRKSPQSNYYWNLNIIPTEPKPIL